MRLRRASRFDDLIRRQLDLFAEDEAETLEEARTADDAWTNATRDDAEELYGDYQLTVDALGEGLYDLRESYAVSLDATAAAEYGAAFDRAARKRFPRYASFLEDDG